MSVYIYFILHIYLYRIKRLSKIPTTKTGWVATPHFSGTIFWFLTNIFTHTEKPWPRLSLLTVNLKDTKKEGTALRS